MSGRGKVAAGFAAGVLVAAGVAVLVMPSAPEEATESVVSEVQLEVCRGLVFNLSGEVAALYTLAASGDEKATAERLPAHAENWNEKVVGTADVCGAQIVQGPGS